MLEITMMRSLLYVPGISERMILKARDSAADALILDLEDGVSPNQKREARATVVRLLNEIDFGGEEIFVPPPVHVEICGLDGSGLDLSDQYAELVTIEVLLKMILELVEIGNGRGILNSAGSGHLFQIRAARSR